MLIVDQALKQRESLGSPIRVGLCGMGFMGKGIVNQVFHYVPGMKISIIVNRTPGKVAVALTELGISSFRIVDSPTAINECARDGIISIVSDPRVACESGCLDVMVEATGAIEYGAKVSLLAIEYRIPLILMNAEIDSTVGPLLKKKADEAGIIITGCDGDQPAVQLNLCRTVQTFGLTPLVCGNIKGLQDHYRNPTTQERFAKEWGQTASMVTSFADGTKISFEQAIVANATGMKVQQRGMTGWNYDGHVDDLVARYDIDKIRELGGVVDYVVGAKPSPGVYVFAECHDKHQAHYLNYGKLGKGPLYSFYIPYHLTVFEVAVSIARVVLFSDDIISATHGPVVDVIATAKIDLKAGEVIDGLGEYKTYGVCENSSTVIKEGLLPMGIAEGCKLKRDLNRDEAISYADVELPMENLAVKLRLEQDSTFFE
jgi:predicted homoserine dehydrogenase-like protein